MANLSPMMRQYMDIKDQHPNELLFFRLGDFYELFFEDAQTASRELELTLTARDCGLAERAPMCGVPHHAAETYINRLLDKGYRVAICEQLSDPAKGSALVERGVVRIITPGTVVEPSMLDERAHNYIVTFFKQGDLLGLTYTDISIGVVHAGQFPLSEGVALDELWRLQPKEVLLNSEMMLYLQSAPILQKTMPAAMTQPGDDTFTVEVARARIRAQMGEEATQLLPPEQMPAALCAVGALLSYLLDTQKNTLSHINTLQVYQPGEYMHLDIIASRNLELTQTMRTRSRKGSLLWTLDSTQTSAGSRLLKRWLEQPLQSPTRINERLDAVEELKADMLRSDAIADALRNTCDIERLLARIAYNTLNARDCLALLATCKQLPVLQGIVQGCHATLLMRLQEQLDPLADIQDLLARAIADDPPIALREGGIIRSGYDQQLDNLRSIYTDARDVITQMELSEREATGIKNLRIGFNKVFGYYIEVTKSYLGNVPYRYTRKQTLANAERFITPELKDLENTILHAEEQSAQLEYDLFQEIRTMLDHQIRRMQATALVLAELDVLTAFAHNAVRHQYVRPSINTQGVIQITDGRHPVVERALQSHQYVPNNTLLDKRQNRFAIITGPNMSGKSTYLRQVALITILAHIGSFVPARKADICITDSVFTRVGASDDLFMGQSTFMVEMSEMAAILKNATPNSLIILDEIGRGTSTFDGLSIAWAVVEYLADERQVGAKTLFATHYHELTELEGKVPGVKNYCITVREHGNDVIFLRKIARGGADKSFGVHVAAMAGLPEAVLERAHDILRRLEKADLNKNLNTPQVDPQRAADLAQQMNFMDIVPYSDILDEIRSLDITATSPLEALLLVNRLQERMQTK